MDHGHFSTRTAMEPRKTKEKRTGIEKYIKNRAKVSGVVHLQDANAGALAYGAGPKLI